MRQEEMDDFAKMSGRRDDPQQLMEQVTHLVPPNKDEDQDRRREGGQRQSKSYRRRNGLTLSSLARQLVWLEQSRTEDKSKLAKLSSGV